VVDEAIAALCAEAVGAMEALRDLTVDYLKQRQQFGRAIGEFQALQHRAADMLVATEQARSMAMYAAMMVQVPDAAARRTALSRAKALVGKLADQLGKEAMQLHGGHRGDRGIQGRPLLQAADHARRDVRRHRSPSRQVVAAGGLPDVT
jgi:alkylation response protein AidB-like acyl-CoA dehydrogenase